MDFPLLDKINSAIVNPLIMLFMALALVYFVFGVYKFVAGSASSTERATGAQHMIWGIIGLFIMLTAFGIMKFVCNVIGCISNG